MTETTGAPKKPWYKKPLVWIIVGVLVVGIAVTSQAAKKDAETKPAETASSTEKKNETKPAENKPAEKKVSDKVVEIRATSKNKGKITWRVNNVSSEEMFTGEFVKTVEVDENIDKSVIVTVMGEYGKDDNEISCKIVRGGKLADEKSTKGDGFAAATCASFKF
ncbi:MAG: hypothetical protein Q4C71_06260 [Microbacteriaceae bacterium]|nr:hypothetical protein [Microbacteriaceae bacterium]